MTSQHWFKQWLGAGRQQATTWANVDLDRCHHMVSSGHSELMKLVLSSDIQNMIFEPNKTSVVIVLHAQLYTFKSYYDAIQYSTVMLSV